MLDILPKEVLDEIDYLVENGIFKKDRIILMATMAFLYGEKKGMIDTQKLYNKN